MAGQVWVTMPEVDGLLKSRCMRGTLVGHDPFQWNSVMDKDNPQEIGYIAWLAGIIDGEGSIGLLVSERKQRPNGIDIRVMPKIIIANTDAGIIDRCLEAFRVIGVGHYIQHKRHAARRVVGIEVKVFKPVTTLEVSGLQRVDTLLKAVTPWLAGSGEKKERAELLLAFFKRRFEKSGEGQASNYKYDEEDIRLILAFLVKTRSKRIEHVAKILNERTRDAVHTRRLARRRIAERDANRELNRKRRERRAKMRSGLAGDS